MKAPIEQAAYLSLTDANSYCAARQITHWPSSSAAQRQAALLTASDWVDHLFRFRGERLVSTQKRAWPRRGAGGPFAEAPETLPPAIIQVVMELALALLESEAEAARYLGLSGAITRERVGDVSISYDSQRPARQSRALRLLAPYLDTVVKVVR